jgi:serine/threonine protein kinase
VDDLRSSIINKGFIGTIYNRYGMGEYTKNDFEVIRLLGKGAFGTVWLVKKLEDEWPYAMKQMAKKFIIQNSLRKNIIMEKQILFHNRHPFMVGMDSVFQDEKNVYFILDFIQGGELFTHLKQRKRFDEDSSKFYAMQIASALGYLHQRDIIYRDLKPENILLHKDGYIKLTDFGLAKCISKSKLTDTLWGTAEYLAPEILSLGGHNFWVDWWTLGILIYEMLIGITPFWSDDTAVMFDFINNIDVRFPDQDRHGFSVSPNAKDLILKLLDKDPEKRLGSQNGVKEVLEHPWFDDYDLDKLLSRQVIAPFIPEISDDPFDTQNFPEKEE